MTTQTALTSGLVGPRGQPLKGPGRQPTVAQVQMIPGLSFWKGTVAEEYLAELKPWSKAFKVLREMSDDPVIGTLYESVKAPLVDAKFDIIPASSTQADLDAADWLRANTLNAEHFDWLDHVLEMLEALEYGFSLSEIVLEKLSDGRLWLSDLLPIGQETLHLWGPLDKHGKVTSFTQTVQAGSFNRTPTRNTAPMSKLLHYPFRARKRNPMGRSLSRGLYRPWYFKKNLEVVEAIGAERDVGNVPVAQLGEGFISNDDRSTLRQSLEGLRMDETAFLIVPNGVEVKPFGAGGKVYNVREIIRDYQHTIRQRFFMDFVSFGSESVGTQALAKEVTGFFSLALGSIQRELLSVWNKQLIPYMFRFNMLSFDGISNLPTIQWSRPGKLNVQSLAQSVTTLLQAGAIHHTPELEHWLRDQFEMPPISEEDLAKAIAEEEAAIKAEQQASLNPQKGQVPGSGAKERPSGSIA